MLHLTTYCFIPHKKAFDLSLNQLVKNIHTSTEGIYILIKMEADHRPVMVDDVSLAIPGTGDNLLPPITLKQTRTEINT